MAEGRDAHSTEVDKMIIQRFTATSLLAGALLLTASCGEKSIAYGDPNSIIAVMPDEAWDAISEDVYAAFERRITTVRDEKTFTVTHQAPYAEHWLNLRRFRQMLVVGSASDPWVEEVLDEARQPITEVGVHQVYDVWANGQTVTLVLLPDGWSPGDAVSYLDQIHTMLDSQYHAYARNRMYMSGRDTALADTLETEEGFLLELPMVYRWHREDSVFVFRNDNPDPSELIREIVVTWRSPAAGMLSKELMVDWRSEVVAAHYSEPQDMALEGMLEEELDYEGHEALQLQAQWRNPPELGWPAGGPFITRAITCDEQDRTYLIDAWLYAPGKEKYEYMIQLETILDTFECG